MLSRRAARASLTEFARYIAGHEAATHHKLLCAKLEAVERGEIDRLMICMPPGHAKTTYGSNLFPAWYLGRHPERQICAASHTGDFATAQGRKVRNLIIERSYASLFPGTQLADDGGRADWWYTKAKGEYFAVGVGGSVTGHRADLFLIDDPVKNREAAESEVQREAVWQWFTSEVLPRLKPGAAIVLIMTRWHDDDLAGRIDALPGKPWHKLILPALALDKDPMQRQPGEALWPAWQDREALIRIKDQQPPRTWESLYQQRPTADEGDYFKRQWFRLIQPDKWPTRLTYYGASDYAITDGGGDWTVHIVVGVDGAGKLYVCDLWRAQTAADEWIEAAISMMAKWKPATWTEEKAQIEKAVGPFLLKRMRERKVFTYREQVSSAGDKAAKARAIQGRLAMDGIGIPADAPWADDLIHECLRFPAGKHDDQVDALGLIGRGLETMHHRDKAKKLDYSKLDRAIV